MTKTTKLLICLNFCAFVVGCTITTTNNDSDTNDTGTETNTGTTNDYWLNGYCPGESAQQQPIVASNNCADVAFAGCCDDSGNVLYCQENKLYCYPCGSYPQYSYCSWYEDIPDDTAQETLYYYWCTETDNGPDPSGNFPRECGSDIDGGVDAGN